MLYMTDTPDGAMQTASSAYTPSARAGAASRCSTKRGCVRGYAGFSEVHQHVASQKLPGGMDSRSPALACGLMRMLHCMMA